MPDALSDYGSNSLIAQIYRLFYYQAFVRHCEFSRGKPCDYVPYYQVTTQSVNTILYRFENKLNQTIELPLELPTIVATRPDGNNVAARLKQPIDNTHHVIYNANMFGKKWSKV